MFPEKQITSNLSAKGSDLDMYDMEGQHRRVMVIDDEAESVSLIKYVLMNAGIDVISATDGQGALQKISHAWPDLILLDVMMPGMDGWEVFKELRRLTNAPVMIVSARTNKEDIVQGLHIGADDYITKPFDPSELVARLNRISNLHKQKRPLQVYKFPEIHLEIDSSTREVTLDDRVIYLPPREFGVLAALARRSDRWVDLMTISSEVWGETNIHIQNRIKYLIFLLRSHLEKDPGKSCLLLSSEG